MRNLKIIVDDVTMTDIVVDDIECQESAGGTLELRATFPPVDMSDHPMPTRAELDSIVTSLGSLQLGPGEVVITPRLPLPGFPTGTLVIGTPTNLDGDA